MVQNAIGIFKAISKIVENSILLLSQNSLDEFCMCVNFRPITQTAEKFDIVYSVRVSEFQYFIPERLTAVI